MKKGRVIEVWLIEKVEKEYQIDKTHSEKAGIRDNIEGMEEGKMDGIGMTYISLLCLFTLRKYGNFKRKHQSKCG